MQSKIVSIAGANPIQCCADYAALFKTLCLVLSAGLRAHELATLLPVHERHASDHRTWDSRRFHGLAPFKSYTVEGKGNLIREVAIENSLANILEMKRRSPIQVVDREIFYDSHYNLAFGQSWSQSFTAASNAALGFSRGGHGLRHSYSKHRLTQLFEILSRANPQESKQKINELALLILSQELGHFRKNIVFCYLR
jgi:integrase